jgi:hypothetical protein
MMLLGVMCRIQCYVGAYRCAHYDHAWDISQPALCRQGASTQLGHTKNGVTTQLGRTKSEGRSDVSKYPLAATPEGLNSRSS